MSPALLACPACDCLQRDVALPPGGIAECARCGETLHEAKPESLDRTLAFMAGAGILFAIANAYPIFGLDAQGTSTSATLFQTGRELWDQGERLVALHVFVTTLIAPAVEIAAAVYLLGFLKAGVIAPGLPTVFRVLNRIAPWGMVEVFMLGTLVALVKLSHIASVEVGPGLYALGATMGLLAAAWASFEPTAFWDRVGELQR